MPLVALLEKQSAGSVNRLHRLNGLRGFGAENGCTATNSTHLTSTRY